MVMWGIPEKSIKNVAQRRWPWVRRTLQSKVMTRNRFLEIPPVISPLIWAHAWQNWFLTFLSDFSVCTVISTYFGNHMRSYTWFWQLLNFLSHTTEAELKYVERGLGDCCVRVAAAEGAGVVGGGIWSATKSLLFSLTPFGCGWAWEGDTLVCKESSKEGLGKARL